MAHFFRAETWATEYYFEVCDDPAGACTHPTPELKEQHHRRYSWWRTQGTDPITGELLPEAMTPARCVDELKLLEALRSGPMSSSEAKETPVPLTLYEGASL